MVEINDRHLFCKKNGPQNSAYEQKAQSPSQEGFCYSKKVVCYKYMNTKVVMPFAIGAVIIISLGTAMFAYNRETEVEQSINQLELPVPYISQAPDGVWINPWASACEEASIVMVEAYYKNENSIDKNAAKQKMENMFEWENEIFGKNFSTTAEETSILVVNQADFETEVKPNPTLEEIKNELRKKRPVIAFIDQFTLNLKPRREVTSFHVIVIVGFDNTTQEFIINDPAYPERRFPYNRTMEALHDYDEVTDEALGPPVVLFTRPKPTLK